VLKLVHTTQTLAERVGARIVALRQDRGLTQEALAWQAEFGSKGYLSRIESGQRMPSVAVLERLAKELGVELRDLFVFPEESVVDAAHEAVRRGGKLFALRVLDLASPRKRR
jgi:transcriptional regulator with XRE-family HTH domain